MKNFNRLTEITTTCPFCGKTHEVCVYENDFYDWQDGKLAQDAFPYLSAATREMLISGICPTCWDGMFDTGEDTDEEDVKDIYSIEIDKLIEGLNTYHIPYEVNKLFDGYQITYPNPKNCVCDAICHEYSYGHEEGLLEIMGLVSDDKSDDAVLGYLTAKEVLGRIHAHYYGTV